MSSRSRGRSAKRSRTAKKARIAKKARTAKRTRELKRVRKANQVHKNQTQTIATLRAKSRNYSNRIAQQSKLYPYTPF